MACTHFQIELNILVLKIAGNKILLSEGTKNDESSQEPEISISKLMQNHQGHVYW